MPKSCERLIGFLISQVLRMIDRILIEMINRSTDMPMTCDDLLES